MTINKHTKQGLGSLTTITNPENGTIMFIAKEVAGQWGHTNLTQALKRIIGDDEKKLVKKKDYPDFMNHLVLNNLLSTKAQSVWLINESGLYKLILSSNLESAIPFKDWVTKEVLPSIRKYGSYSLRLSQSDLYNQTKIETQLDNSKKVNAMNYQKNGLASTIDYNRKNCEQVTGLQPHKIKDMFNAKKSKSAKQVLRENKPEFAAVMSLNDFLVINNNIDLEQLREIDNAFIPAFKSLINAGFEITK